MYLQHTSGILLFDGLIKFHEQAEILTLFNGSTFEERRFARVADSIIKVSSIQNKEIIVSQ